MLQDFIEPSEQTAAKLQAIASAMQLNREEMASICHAQQEHLKDAQVERKCIQDQIYLAVARTHLNKAAALQEQLEAHSDVEEGFAAQFKAKVDELNGAWAALSAQASALVSHPMLQQKREVLLKRVVIINPCNGSAFEHVYTDSSDRICKVLAGGIFEGEVYCLADWAAEKGFLPFWFEQRVEV